MNANDAQMVRVYTREASLPADESVADISFAHQDKFKVVVECEAGQAVFDSGAPFRIDITVRCLTHHLEPDIDLHRIIEGTLASPQWNTLKKRFEAPEIDCEHLSTAEPMMDCYEVLAVLSVGRNNPDISFARSPLFVCQAP